MGYMRIDVDGERGPTHADAPCPKCRAKVEVMIPAGAKKQATTCKGCGTQLTLEVPR
jgi:transcription elongation factor Elf1